MISRLALIPRTSSSRSARLIALAWSAQGFPCAGRAPGLALALEALAGAFGLTGDYETSVRLLGASDSVRRAASTPSASSEQAGIDRIAAAARAALGKAAFGAAYQHGSAQTPEDATAVL